MEWLKTFAETNPEITGIVVFFVLGMIGDAISHFIRTGPQWLQKYESQWVKLRNAIGNAVKKKLKK